MFSIERGHILFKQEFNKLDSNHNKDFPPAFIDDAIYQGMLDMIEFYHGASLTKNNSVGFEVTQDKIDLLEHFVVPEESVSVSGSSNRYEINLYSDLNKPYLHLKRINLTSDCNDDPVIVRIVPHSKLSYFLRDTNHKPSKKWNRALAVIADNKLIIYTDFEITSATLTYIRRPTKHFIGGYDTLEYISGDLNQPNKLTPKINLDLPDNYITCQAVIRFTVSNMQRILQDYNGTQFTQNKILATN